MTEDTRPPNDEEDARRRWREAREDYESNLDLSDDVDRPIRERWRARCAGFRAWLWRRDGNTPPDA